MSHSFVLLLQLHRGVKRSGTNSSAHGGDELQPIRAFRSAPASLSAVPRMERSFDRWGLGWGCVGQTEMGDGPDMTSWDI